MAIYPGSVHWSVSWLEVLWHGAGREGLYAAPEPEPEPIMVEEGEQDEVVAAILDANVGLREADATRCHWLHAPCT